MFTERLAQQKENVLNIYLFYMEFSMILSQGSQDFLVSFPTWEDVQVHILFEQKRRYKEL